MPTCERRLDSGKRRADRLLRELAEEAREARIGAGLSQADVARALGCSRWHVTRMERAAVTNLGIRAAALLMSVLGRELSVRSYPVGPPIRDAAHVALLERLRTGISPAWRWRYEVPVAGVGDQRSYDAVLESDGARIAVEAETRLRDVQALLRRLELKLRDGGVTRLIVVVRDTRTNRAALRAADVVVRAAYPLASRRVIAALRRGRDPGANGIVVV